VGRVLFLLHQLAGGGAERQLVVLARGLQTRGHHVVIAAYEPGGSYEHDLDGTGVEVVCLHKSSVPIVGNFSFFSHLRRLVSTHDPDVVHGYLDTGNFAAALLRLLTPGRRIVLGVRSSRVDLRVYDWHWRVIATLNRGISRLSHLIIANSRAGAQYAITRGYPAAKVVAVPNGIDTVRFAPDLDGRARIRSELGVASGAPLIGIVARLDPMKGYDVFLSAARLLASKQTDVQFVCIGDHVEPYRSRVLRLMGESCLKERLSWLGFRSDIQAVYSALDISTSASTFGEGFSNATAEAMACGVPCVVTAVGDSADIVGDTGTVIPPGSPEALAAAWETMLPRLGPELSARCRNRIVEEFSVERLVTRTEQLLWPQEAATVAAPGDHLESVS
jgi:glycosyltransferase involved in cell wall biosynthesis